MMFLAFLSASSFASSSIRLMVLAASNFASSSMATINWRLASPAVVLVVGVNGTGKTTTIGKLSQRLQTEGKKVMLAAGDTFRAAAAEQLAIWGERVGIPVIKHR